MNGHANSTTLGMSMLNALGAAMLIPPYGDPRIQLFLDLPDPSDPENIGAFNLYTGSELQNSQQFGFGTEAVNQTFSDGTFGPAQFVAISLPAAPITMKGFVIWENDPSSGFYGVVAFWDWLVAPFTFSAIGDSMNLSLQESLTLVQP
jgi:hypothetical protein